MALLPFLSTISDYCIPSHGIALGTTAWGTANLIIYVPLRVPEDCTALKVFWGNGNTVAGNVNLGLYNAAGSRQWETGSTAMSGSNAPQFVNIADQAITAGLYYLALQSDSTTAAFDRITAAALFHVQGRWGVLEEAAGSFALPATATFVKRTATWVPAFGIDLRGTP